MAVLTGSRSGISVTRGGVKYMFDSNLERDGTQDYTLGQVGITA